jgi:hypothetical protein
MNLPEKVGVTAYLTIDYRAPTKADQVLRFYPCNFETNDGANTPVQVYCHKD